jgi:hypothetical protein
MSLTTWSWWRARVIILIVLVSSCAYGRCFFAVKSTTDLHTGVGVWVGEGACVCVGGGGSLYLGCVSGGVATVISLGIRSSLGFRFRIRFRVGIRCCTPDTRPGCCGPDARALARAPPIARSPTYWCVDPGGETEGNVITLVSPFSGCSDLWASLLGGSELWVYGILTSCMSPSCMSPSCMSPSCMSPGCMSPSCMSPSYMWISGSLCGCLLWIVWFFGFFLGRMARW